ncbi:hypothetical protein Sden_1685 [Shewanella denitrificans OS217]|uniref:Peptidase A2 domain-containing protein n=1 Tax=Shewanella denitrificans (strain OS217 / ATCC BAA-1090 / DSM 15013) TaxID=318161 RepID=Q12NK7_SHEDO|nr:aspartyl protease family protein [Shewanella denitrificans]ABE54969.1 hypothetical protein Sden_1685 [Shewanella denitrificans OS217]
MMTLRKLMRFNKLNSLLRALCTITLIVGLSGCQLYQMASLRWHNANTDVVWQGENNTSSLSFTMMNNHILVPVRVNGGEPMMFVLDSGAAASVLTQTRATKALKLPLNNPIQISGTGDGPAPTAYIVHDQHITLGSLSVEGLSMVYAPADAMPFQNEEETYFDGVLGADFFNCCLVEIDHDKQQLHFHRPTGDKKIQYENLNWQRLTMEVENNTPYLRTSIDSQSRKAQVKVMLDTGSTGTLSLKVGINPNIQLPEKTFQSRSIGIKGYATQLNGLLDTIRLGDYKITDFNASFKMINDDPEDDSDGILGNQIMKRFNMVFDFNNETLWLRPSKLYQNPVPKNSSGLLLLPHTQGAVVRDITPNNSSIHALGIKENSIITHIHGQAVTAKNFDILTGLLQSPDTNQVPLCWTWQDENHCDVLRLQDSPKTASHIL